MNQKDQEDPPFDVVRDDVPRFALDSLQPESSIFRTTSVGQREPEDGRFHELIDQETTFGVE